MQCCGGIVTVPVAVWCTFWRHFAVLTIFLRPGLKQDHSFLVREGWRLWESQEIKVVTYGAGS